MSNFSQFSSGGIKSIQRGKISIAPTQATGTATITAVNPAKSELRLLGVAGLTTTTGDYTGNSLSQGMVVLTNSTTVTATLGRYQAAGYGNAEVSWELTEWN